MKFINQEKSSFLFRTPQNMIWPFLSVDDQRHGYDTPSAMDHI